VGVKRVGKRKTATAPSITLEQFEEFYSAQYPRQVGLTGN
jgi:hypothetical protein